MILKKTAPSFQSLVFRERISIHLLMLRLAIGMKMVVTCSKSWMTYPSLLVMIMALSVCLFLIKCKTEAQLFLERLSLEQSNLATF
jgi:hypothetical protein